MKSLISLIILFTLPFMALSQQESESQSSEKTFQHYVYIEAIMPYDIAGSPGTAYMHIGPTSKIFIDNWRDLEATVSTYKSTMDIVNYMDENGFEFIDRALFLFKDGISETFIFRKPR